ncbi:TonB-dependent receptor plug domain-containing protein [Aliikangiella maris]|uniref:TonB-dependent receptor n=2 Tax=Aliikangiella maris TaxID=3162458 RepID=A0ABV2BYG0_9GAMM
MRKTMFLLGTLLVLANNAYSSEIEDIEFNELESIESIITATKLKQPIKDVPASVTIITSEQLKQYGIKRVPDALELVPGMAVAKASGNDYRISYHGTNGLSPRRMQVLIDGVSIYRYGLASVDWMQIPVLIDQVEKIVVTRTPSGTTYGANSFFAVVNIITKHTSKTQGINGFLSYGSLDTSMVGLSKGGSFGDTSYRVAISHDEGEGYDENYLAIDRQDAHSIDRISWKSNTMFDGGTELNTGVFYSTGDIANEYADPYQQEYPHIEVEDLISHAGLAFDINNKNRMDLSFKYIRMDRKQEWRTCPPTLAWVSELRDLHFANPELAAMFAAGIMPTEVPPEDQPFVDALLMRLFMMGNSVYEPLCGDLNQNYVEKRYVFEVNDTYVYSDNFRLVTGLHFAVDRFESETYAFETGKLSSDYIYWMTNAEYKPTENLSINLGAIFEHSNRLREDYYDSTRIAVNYNLTQEQTIRFSTASSIRTPDLMENDRNWSFLGRNLDQELDGSSEAYIYFNSVNADELEPEEIRSTEIGYYGNFSDIGLKLDVKLFHEDLTNLISERIDFFDLASLTNGGEARLKGYEIQAEYNPNKQWSARLAYGYLDSETEEFFEETLYAKHKGSVNLLYRFDAGTTMLGYYGSSKLSSVPYRRYEWVTRLPFKLGGSDLEVEFKVTTHFGDYGYIVDPKFAVENKFDDSTHYLLSLEYAIK